VLPSLVVTARETGIMYKGIDVKVCVFNIRSCCLPDITSSQNGLIFSMTFSNMETTICLKHDEDSIDDGTTADPLELITPSPINI